MSESSQGVQDSARPMRIACIGTPMDAGLTYIMTQLFERLPDLGFEIDCYSPSGEELVPDRLRDMPGLRFFYRPLRYQPGRWYSRTKLGGFVVGQSERALAQGFLADRIRQEHSVRPYDCVYQFSQLELFALRAFRKHLPPLVVHPETHAAGELRWLRRERTLSDASTGAPWNTAVRAMMRSRAEIQRRDIRQARLVIAPSARFAELLTEDYGLPRERIAVVRNPIDLSRHAPREDLQSSSSQPQTLLFISRMSVRKGVEMVVKLSHQLADLEGEVRIALIGGHSAWSDYRPLLRDLHPGTAQYYGHIPEPILAGLYERAAAVIQPSRFEPFGLTIAEALATGVPVVASTEVGAIDGLDPSVCRAFPDGDSDAFERVVRGVLSDTTDQARRRELGQLARAEAERLFSPDVSARALADALRRVPDLTSANGSALQARHTAWR